MQTDLDQSLLRNLADLDLIAARIDSLEGKIFREIYSFCREWCSARGWDGNFDWDGDNLWFAPPQWQLPSERGSGADAWFQLSAGHGDEEDATKGDDYWWLTRLCRIGSGQLVFRFVQDRRAKREWKGILREAVRQGEFSDWQLDDEPTLCTSCEISAEKLTEALDEDDLGVAVDGLTHKFGLMDKSVKRLDSLLGPRKPL